MNVQKQDITIAISMKLKRILRPYLPFLIIRLENWLSKMSQDGFALYSVNGWRFTFITSAPKKREYFWYSSFGSHKGISYDFYRAKRKYQANKTKINNTVLEVFEVDPFKTDKEYYSYRELRNKYYKNHYYKFLAFSTVLILLSLLASILERSFTYSGILGLILFIYSLVATIILKFDSNKKDDHSVSSSNDNKES